MNFRFIANSIVAIMQRHTRRGSQLIRSVWCTNYILRYRELHRLFRNVSLAQQRQCQSPTSQSIARCGARSIFAFAEDHPPNTENVQRQRMQQQTSMLFKGCIGDDGKNNSIAIIHLSICSTVTRTSSIYSINYLMVSGSTEFYLVDEY